MPLARHQKKMSSNPARQQPKKNAQSKKTISHAHKQIGAHYCGPMRTQTSRSRGEDPGGRPGSWPRLPRRRGRRTGTAAAAAAPAASGAPAAAAAAGASAAVAGGGCPQRRSSPPPARRGPDRNPGADRARARIDPRIGGLGESRSTDSEANSSSGIEQGNAGRGGDIFFFLGVFFPPLFFFSPRRRALPYRD